jgi:GNAT superfamily N-acetyltransferase
MPSDLPSRLIFRRAVLADVPEIVRLLAADSLGSHREHYDPEDLPAGYKAAFEEIDRDPRQLLAVAELDGQVVGTFQMTYLRYLTYQGAVRAQIEAVRVDARFRSRGIGGLMMGWAIDQARASGCRLLQLTTHKSRVDAHRFYQRLGFTASHEGMKLYLE